MKKTLLSAAAVLASFCPANAQTLLSADFTDQTVFNQWTVIDANEDGKTWNFDTTTETLTQRTRYSCSSTNAGDDWLISPAITAQKDCKVIVQFNVRAGLASWYDESAEVWAGTSPTVGGMTVKGAESKSLPGSFQPLQFEYEAKAGEPFYVGIHATSPADYYYIYISSAKVFTADRADLQIAAITSPTKGTNLAQENVTAKVTNTGYVTANGFDIAMKIDGADEVVEHCNDALAVGDTIAYTFKAKADLSATGKHSVQVFTKLADELDTDNDSLTISVKHMVPATVPYSNGFESTDNTEDLTVINANGDTGSSNGYWHVLTNSWFTTYTDRGSRCLGVGYNKTLDMDDWAFLEPIQVEAGYYNLKFWYSGDDSHPEKLAVYYGSEPTVEAMTNEVVTYAPFLSPNGYAQSSSIMHFDEPQVIYIGFHGYSDKDENWLTIDDVTFDKADSSQKDVLISDFSLPAEYIHQNSKKDVKFSVKNNSIDDMNVHYTIYLDGEEAYTDSIETSAQIEATETFSELIDDLAVGEHTIKLAISADGDVDESNNTAEKTFRVLPAPVKFWDFEKMALPAELTFRSEDEGTINSNASEYYDIEGNDSWAAIPAESTQTGSYMMGCCTYLDGVSKADRWCVLPKMNIANANYYVAWDALAFNASYPEAYEIKVSDGDDTTWDYSKVWSTALEANTIQTHGVSLAKYAGKDVYIAIRVVSRPGDMVLFDNLGIYDCSESATGIRGIENNAANGQTTIYNVGGQRIGSMQKGINIVRTADGKVVKIKK